MTNILARWEEIERLRGGGYVRPKFATLHTSDACNQNCIGCAYGGKHTGAKMKQEAHWGAINRLIDFGVQAFEFCGGEVPARLAVVGRLELDPDALAAVEHGAVDFAPDAGKWRQDHLSGVRPQHTGALDDVELEGVDVPLVVLLFCLTKWERTVKPNVIPKRAGVLPPNPLAVTVLKLTTFPTSIRKDVIRYWFSPGVICQPGRMRNRHSVFPVLAENQKVIRVCD